VGITKRYKKWFEAQHILVQTNLAALATTGFSSEQVCAGPVGGSGSNAPWRSPSWVVMGLASVLFPAPHGRIMMISLRIGSFTPLQPALDRMTEALGQTGLPANPDPLTAATRPRATALSANSLGSPV
jgi:hypothetical protein